MRVSLTFFFEKNQRTSGRCQAELTKIFSFALYSCFSSFFALFHLSPFSHSFPNFTLFSFSAAQPCRLTLPSLTLPQLGFPLLSLTQNKGA